MYGSTNESTVSLRIWTNESGPLCSQEENIHQDPPAEVLPPQQKFSLQTAWLVVKLLPRGYLVRLACRDRTRLWLEYGENIVGTNIITKHDLNKHIFEGGHWTNLFY